MDGKSEAVIWEVVEGWYPQVELMATVPVYTPTSLVASMKATVNHFVQEPCKLIMVDDGYLVWIDVY